MIMLVIVNCISADHTVHLERDYIPRKHNSYLSIHDVVSNYLGHLGLLSMLLLSTLSCVVIYLFKFFSPFDFGICNVIVVG